MLGDIWVVMLCSCGREVLEQKATGSEALPTHYSTGEWVAISSGRR
jgi:hypothetical protein